MRKNHTHPVCDSKEPYTASRRAIHGLQSQSRNYSAGRKQACIASSFDVAQKEFCGAGDGTPRDAYVHVDEVLMVWLFKPFVRKNQQCKIAVNHTRLYMYDT